GVADEKQTAHVRTLLKGVGLRKRDAIETGCALSLAAAQKSELFEQMHVLLVLQERAMQWRDQLFGLLLAQRLGRDVLVEEKFQPVEQFRGRRLFLEPRRLAQGEERTHRLFDEDRLDSGKVRFDDCAHRVWVRKADVVEEAPAQERVGQLLFVVRRDDDDRPQLRADRFSSLVHVKFHLIEFEQKVVGELDVGLIDLVD